MKTKNPGHPSVCVVKRGDALYWCEPERRFVPDTDKATLYERAEAMLVARGVRGRAVEVISNKQIQ